LERQGFYFDKTRHDRNRPGVLEHLFILYTGPS
jgi:hypothetical protein